MNAEQIEEVRRQIVVLSAELAGCTALGWLIWRFLKNSLRLEWKHG